MALGLPKFKQLKFAKPYMKKRLTINSLNNKMEHSVDKIGNPKSKVVNKFMKLKGFKNV
jgi:hypothetical protein